MAEQKDQKVRRKSSTWRLIGLVYAAAIGIVWLFTQIENNNLVSDEGSFDRHKILLENFATFTVEVVYDDASLKSKFGQDENALSYIALKKFAGDAEIKFGKTISYSRFGKPYSFQTNPLNLAITFKIEQCPFKNWLCITSAFGRTEYLFIYQSPNDPSLQTKHKELIKQGLDGITKPTRYEELDTTHKGGPVYFSNLDEFTQRIDFLSAIIVNDMKPNEEKAIVAEEKLREEIKNNKQP